ncbi:hypothetical protein GGTG_11838 [Gaeumannomyces tritici R3-111a-1]|uniref:WW domain-containing protein n=1 Tax=Gaeumannomyces tritici (strain R3-111a-1) TaxID=644352 RepID=J3PEB5_GAET3|nr:hypothetical protein GGTG_11838 [Gaeumannomyces tritici R3-111a-1]EJT70815.1 hypothetical protein GGTG_11838 [Gaeumannomyces tritici R3-111a-1]
MAPKISLSNVPVPYAYSKRISEDGHVYHADHATRTTSWLHPGKLKALQDAGVVGAAPGLPDFVKDPRAGGVPAPVPAPWEAREGREPGEVEYRNRDTGAVEGIHPDAAALARNRGGREVATSTLLPWDDKGMAEEADVYLARGELPPWVLEETTAPPAGSGLKPEVYWVNYRTGLKREGQSPLQEFNEGMLIARQRALGLPVSTRGPVRNIKL